MSITLTPPLAAVVQVSSAANTVAVVSPSLYTEVRTSTPEASVV